MGNIKNKYGEAIFYLLDSVFTFKKSMYFRKIVVRVSEMLGQIQKLLVIFQNISRQLNMYWAQNIYFYNFEKCTIFNCIPVIEKEADRVSEKNYLKKDTTKILIFLNNKIK